MARPHLVVSLRSTPMRTVSVAGTYMAAVSAAGNLYTWGLGLDGQLGHGPSTLELSTPQLVDSVGSVADPKDGALMDVVCSVSHLMCLSASGKVLTCGKGADGRLGHGDEANVFSPQVVQRLSGKRVARIALGATFSVAVTASGKDCYSWGAVQENTMGALVPTRLDGFLKENQVVSHISGKGKAVAFVVTSQPPANKAKSDG
jgi:alpha-tubulin suppressor-like RCC1 family protein